MKKRLLVFHSTIAPYRIDFFNELYSTFEARICLRYKNLRSQTFDYEKISSRFLFSPIYMKCLFQWRGRIINSGYWKELNDFKPDVVFVEEFSIGAIIVLLHRFFMRRKYRVVSMCDDSYNMVAENNDFSVLHKMARKLIVPLLDDIILVDPKVKEWYQNHYNKGFEPYKVSWDGDINKLYDGSTYACNGSNNNARHYCTAIIQMNNWTIPDDYPFKVSY